MPFTGRECLTQVEPIDNFDLLALQVAQVTALLGQVIERLDKLERDLSDGK